MSHLEIKHFGALLEDSSLPHKLECSGVEAARYVHHFIRSVDERFSEIVGRVNKAAPPVPWVDYDPYQTLGAFLLDAESTKDESPLAWAAYQLLKIHQQRAELLMYLSGILALSLKETIRAWKIRKGVRRGRRVFLLGNRGFKVAVKVREALPTFERAFSDMRNLKKGAGRTWRKIEARLRGMGYPDDIINGLRGFRSSLSAACNFVADKEEPKLEMQTVQNYYSKYRKVFHKVAVKHLPGTSQSVYMLERS